MKSIILSNVTWREGVVVKIVNKEALYFSNEEDLSEVSSLILQHGNWVTEPKQYQLVIRGESVRVLYIDSVPKWSIIALNGYKRRWDSAKRAAIKRIGWFRLYFCMDQNLRREEILKGIDIKKPTEVRLSNRRRAGL